MLPPRIRRLWRKYVVHVRFHLALARAYRTRKKHMPEWNHTWQTFSQEALRYYRRERRESLFEREEALIYHANWERIVWVSWLREATWHPGCPHCRATGRGSWETVRFRSRNGHLSQTQMLVYHCSSCGKDSNGLPRYGWARIDEPEPPLLKSTRKRAEILRLID